MKDIVNVLSGFFEATKQFSVDNFVTISTVLPVYNCLLQSMTVDVSDSGKMSFLKKILRYYIAKYMTKYIVPNEKLFAAAMFLDIRTKLFGRHNESDKKRYKKLATEFIKGVHVTRQPATPSDNAIEATSDDRPQRRLQIFDLDSETCNSKAISKLTGIDKEIALYASEPPKTINPLEYWQQKKENYPLLFNIVKIIFCIPATSVPCERLFSAAGHNVYELKNRLAPENVEKLMLVYENDC